MPKAPKPPAQDAGFKDCGSILRINTRSPPPLFLRPVFRMNIEKAAQSAHDNAFIFPFPKNPIMQFTQIPQQYAPLGGELRYAVGQAAAGNIDIRIVDAAAGIADAAGPVGDGSALLGAKRFAAVTEAGFDIAPYLRRRVQFVPATGGTGFHAAAGRTVTALVEAATTGGAVEAVSPARTFRPGAGSAEAPCLLTSMPLSRLIPDGACDELTLLTDGPCTVTVTALAGDTASAESYRAAEAGLHLFRLDLRDFPDAESLTVDAGECGTVVYAVIPARQEAVRLAWRSRAGSVEHYSFPVVQTAVVRSVRQQAYGPDGRTAATAETDRETVLASAYEGRQVLEALAELTAAPEVWIADGDSYTPVDIATDEAIVQRHGTLSCLEIAVRPKRKTRTSWN